jgi:hypothetical protein
MDASLSSLSPFSWTYAHPSLNPRIAPHLNPLSTLESYAHHSHPFLELYHHSKLISLSFPLTKSHSGTDRNPISLKHKLKRQAYWNAKLFHLRIRRFPKIQLGYKNSLVDNAVILSTLKALRTLATSKSGFNQLMGCGDGVENVLSKTCEEKCVLG